MHVCLYIYGSLYENNISITLSAPPMEAFYNYIKFYIFSFLTPSKLKSGIYFLEFVLSSWQ
mgnify:CR=1 FL=1